jgi:protein dithiol:quinone oxidoreductase
MPGLRVQYPYCLLPENPMLNFWKNLTLSSGAGLIALACVGMLGFGLYLQHVVGLEPCPMCIVQRYALIFVAACAIFCLASGLKASKNQSRSRVQSVWAGLAVLFAAAGAFVAARQSFLQWYPPEVVSCGRDFYGMVETFPLKRAIPMIFKGGGDCSEVDWTFLGGSIANWSFVAFVAIAMVLVALLLRRKTSAI